MTKENMRFAQLRTQEQLDWQAMHQIRDRLVQRRTALINEIRGFLLERGTTFAAQPKIELPKKAADSAVLTLIGEGTVEDQQTAKLRCGH